MDADQGLSRKKHPYVELFVVTFCMLTIPWLVFTLLSAVMKEYSHYSAVMISAQAETFAGIVGTAFAIMLILSNFFSAPLKIVLERWGELFSDVRLGFWKMGMQSYLHNLKTNGIHFWWYLALTGFEAYLIIDGIKRFFEITGLNSF